jgi:hypothetical protein
MENFSSHRVLIAKRKLLSVEKNFRTDLVIEDTERIYDKVTLLLFKIELQVVNRPPSFDIAEQGDVLDN